MDKIFIRNLTVMTIIGTLPHERLAARPLILNVEMQCNLQPAGESDDLFKSVNYQEAAELLLQMGKDNAFLLVETFAENAAKTILNQYDMVKSVTITVDKPHAIGCAASVGVQITRCK